MYIISHSLQLAIFLLAKHQPKRLAASFLAGSWYLGSTLTSVLSEFSTATDDNLTLLLRVAFVYAAVTLFFGPFLVLTPTSPIVLEKETLFKSLVKGAQAEKTRRVATGIFWFLTAMQGFVVFSLYQVLTILKADVQVIIGMCVGYSLICLIFLCLFYSVMMKKDLVIKGVNLMQTIRQSMLIYPKMILSKIPLVKVGKKAKNQSESIGDEPAEDEKDEPLDILAQQWYTKFYIFMFVVVFGVNGYVIISTLVQDSKGFDSLDTIGQLIVVFGTILNLLMVIVLTLFILNVAFNPVNTSSEAVVDGMVVKIGSIFFTGIYDRISRNPIAEWNNIFVKDISSLNRIIVEYVESAPNTPGYSFSRFLGPLGTLYHFNDPSYMYISVNARSLSPELSFYYLFNVNSYVGQLFKDSSPTSQLDTLITPFLCSMATAFADETNHQQFLSAASQYSQYLGTGQSLADSCQAFDFAPNRSYQSNFLWAQQLQELHSTSAALIDFDTIYSVIQQQIVYFLFDKPQHTLGVEFSKRSKSKKSGGFAFSFGSSSSSKPKRRRKVKKIPKKKSQVVDEQGIDEQGIDEHALDDGAIPPPSLEQDKKLRDPSGDSTEILKSESADSDLVSSKTTGEFDVDFDGDFDGVDDGTQVPLGDLSSSSSIAITGKKGGKHVPAPSRSVKISDGKFGRKSVRDEIRKMPSDSRKKRRRKSWYSSRDILAQNPEILNLTSSPGIYTHRLNAVNQNYETKMVALNHDEEGEFPHRFLCKESIATQYGPTGSLCSSNLHTNLITKLDPFTYHIDLKQNTETCFTTNGLFPLHKSQSSLPKNQYFLIEATVLDTSNSSNSTMDPSGHMQLFFTDESNVPNQLGYFSKKTASSVFIGSLSSLNFVTNTRIPPVEISIGSTITCLLSPTVAAFAFNGCFVGCVPLPQNSSSFKAYLKFDSLLPIKARFQFHCSTFSANQQFKYGLSAFGPLSRPIGLFGMKESFATRPKVQTKENCLPSAFFNAIEPFCATDTPCLLNSDSFSVPYIENKYLGSFFQLVDTTLTQVSLIVQNQVKFLTYGVPTGRSSVVMACLSSNSDFLKFDSTSSFKVLNKALANSEGDLNVLTALSPSILFRLHARDILITLKSNLLKQAWFNGLGFMGTLFPNEMLQSIVDPYIQLETKYNFILPFDITNSSYGRNIASSLSNLTDTRYCQTYYFVYLIFGRLLYGITSLWIDYIDAIVSSNHAKQAYYRLENIRFDIKLDERDTFKAKNVFIESSINPKKGYFDQPEASCYGINSNPRDFYTKIAFSQQLSQLKATLDATQEIDIDSLSIPSSEDSGAILRHLECAKSASFNYFQKLSKMFDILKLFSGVD